MDATSMMTTYDPLAPLATLDEKTGEAPESRVQSIAGVRQRIEEMRRAESTRSLRRAKVEGLLNGNPPYQKAMLAKLNRTLESNINLRTGEGTVDAAKTPYYDLVFESPQFLTVECCYGDDPHRQHEWSAIISDGLHDLFDDWDGFDGQTQLLQWQMCVHGVGNATFLDTTSWHWKSRGVGDVLVRDDAEADIDELDEGAIPRSYLPTDLYKLIKNPSIAGKRWNLDLVRQAIIESAPVDLRNNYGNRWESYEDSLRCGDVAWANRSNRVMVIDYLVREFSGKVTHIIALESDKVGTGKDDGFLFKHESKFECFSQVICPFFYDVTGSGLWHAVKGLGPKIYDFCQLENRLTGRTIDQAMAGIIALAANADDLQRGQFGIQHGPVTFFPPGVTFPTTKMTDTLENQMAVKRDLQNTLQSNTGQYRQRVSAENQEPTLGQAQMNAQQQAILGKGAVNRYYRSQDRLYREMVRRIVSPRISASDPGGKEAKEFIEYCLMRGVPEEALTVKYIRKVKATRSMGYGSPAMREVVSAKLISLAPAMPPQGQRNAMRDALAPYVGQHQVDAYFPPFEQADVPNDHAWAANTENGEMRQPDASLLVTPKQDHLIHFDSHYGNAVDHVKALSAGQANPMEVLGLLHNAGPHMRVHLNAMQGDPTREAQLKQREPAWLNLSKIADQLQQQIEESMKSQQAQQPQVDPAMVAAMAKVHGDLQIKQAKAQGDMALKADKQEFTKRMKDLETAHKLRLANVNAAAQPGPATPAPNKVSESISYKDAPPSVRRQMEQQAGLTPATEAEVSPQAPEPPPTKELAAA